MAGDYDLGHDYDDGYGEEGIEFDLDEDEDSYYEDEEDWEEEDESDELDQLELFDD